MPATPISHLPFAIVQHVAGLRIEAAGPIRRRRQRRDLSTEEWGFSSAGGEKKPFDEGSETYSTRRYAIVAQDGREVAARTDVDILSRSWMGTWGGTTTSNVYAVVDGRPAQRFGHECSWIPAAESAPPDAAFGACELPVAAIVEFQATGVEPSGWAWDADARVLSRSLP